MSDAAVCASVPRLCESAKKVSDSIKLNYY
jgi:hypothetical protein